MKYWLVVSNRRRYKLWRGKTKQKKNVIMEIGHWDIIRSGVIDCF